MKKIILVLVVVAGLSASCKKSYNCECTDLTSTTIKSTSEADADNTCSAMNTSTKTCAVQN